MNKQEVLKITEWYHSTTFSGLESIKAVGVLASFNAGKSLDFGSGFYLSKSLEWSYDYILNSLCKGDRKAAENYVVIKIRFDLKKAKRKFGKEALKFFESQNFDYATFVAENRVENETFTHNHKMVAGPMANDAQIQASEDCKAKLISREALISILQGEEDEIQLLLHSQAVCDTIDLSKDLLEEYPWKEANKQ